MNRYGEDLDLLVLLEDRCGAEAFEGYWTCVMSPHKNGNHYFVHLPEAS